MSKSRANSDGPGRESVPTTVESRRVLVAAIAGGILATALTWVAGEASAGYFKGKEVKNPLAEKVDMADTNRVEVKNAVLAWGVQGALLGLVLGISGALAGRAPRASIRAGTVGLVLGGTLAAGSSSLIFTAFFALVDGNSADMIPSLLSHAGVASLLGLSAGAAFGLGLGVRGGLVRCAVGGIVGAVIGSCLYEVVGALLFPVDKTGDPVASASLARLLCHALIDLTSAVGIALVAGSPARVARTTSSDPLAPSI